MMEGVESNGDERSNNGGSMADAEGGSMAGVAGTAGGAGSAGAGGAGSAGAGASGGKSGRKTLSLSFPQARVRSIIKADKDIQSVTSDAVYAVTAATEMFLEVLAREAFDYSKRDGRKSLVYNDVAAAVNDVQEFEFLTEIVPSTVPYAAAAARRAALADSSAPSAAAMGGE